MSIRLGLTLSLLAAVEPGAALAHHSGAMFEPELRITLNGTIRDFQWTNPHAWIQVAVPGADGKSTDWSFECGSPNTLSRLGWRPATLKPGDAVAIVANPMKDGTHAGLMYTVTLADGRVLGPGAPSAAAPAR
ncbi:MAG: DUF6152 family protein [Gammaproteobacteria bacterium]